MAPSAIMDYKCYYYIEKEKVTNKIILFLLCPLKDNKGVLFSRGIETATAWNIIMENDNDEKSPLLKLKKKKYGFKRFELDDEEQSRKEIIIHSYIAKDDFIVPSEISILVNRENITNSNQVQPDEIAYNKPYVHLSKSQFKSQANKESTFTFYPRVLIPLLKYRIADELDLIDSEKNLDKHPDNCFTAIVPLIKSRATGIYIVEPIKLNTNKAFYLDEERIDSCFEVVVAYFKNSTAEGVFRKKRVGEKKGFEASSKRGLVVVGAEGLSGDSITRKPISKLVKTIPASGIFIDVPPE